MPEQKELFFLNNQNLFSNNYLEHRLPAASLWKEQGERAGEVFDSIKKSYEALKPLKLGSGEEAGIEDKFIRPVLKTLGYEFDVQPRTQRGYKKKRPDYALFKDSASYEEARKEKDNIPRFFAHPLTILEAKYWGRRLNDTDTKDTLDTRDPTAQTVKYLDDVYHASQGRIQWAILTNGKEWRLFYYRAASRSGNFFEINLENIIAENDREKFLYFYLFFSRDAFIPDLATGKTWLDQHLDGSEAYSKAVSDRLKELIFDEAFEGLAEGFIHYRRNELSIQQETDESKKEIFKGCLTLLYRLLFLLYAESRNLLPVEEDSYRRVSLKKLKEDIYRDLKTTEPDKMSKRSFAYFARLEGLFEIIAKGDPALNVPIYNGGLFETAKDNFLSMHKMPDPYLAKAVKLLTVDHEDKYKPGSIPFIDYSSLNVRHLGDIYEGLLEFHIQIADEDMVEVKEGGRLLWKKLSPDRYVRGQAEVKTGAKTNRKKTKDGVYIENSKHERKATGSYYTPHYIVEYIVKNTVNPVLEERFETAAGLLAQFEQAIKASNKQKSTDSIKGYRAKILEIEEALFNVIFDIKVLDPAMGSGHFLVHTVDFISDKIISFLAGYPENPVIKRIEGLKKEIIAEIKRQGVRIDESKLTEVNLIKRMVMKRCIYGVDLNEMAVELAKLSLWLDSFTLGAPLSFLDHHLKCGNSLIGANLEALEKATEGQLFKINIEPLKRAIRGMLFISSLSDATYEQVKDSANKYREADTNVEGYRALLDMLVSEHFGIKEAKSFLLDKGTKIDLNNLKKTIDSMPDRDKKVIEDIEKVAAKKQFFHWEIEFPEVFYKRIGEMEQKVEKKENPGFDCVIGNPPWGAELSRDEKIYCKTFETDTSTPNSYIYIMRRSELLSSPKGFVGVIVPDSILVKDYAITRYNLLTNNTLLYIIYLERVFKDVNHDCAVIIFRRGRQDQHNLLGGIVPRNETAIETFLSPLEESYFNDSELEYRFNLNFSPVNSILYQKLFTLQKIGDVGDFHEGIHTGNVREKLFYKTKPSYCDPVKIKPCLIGSNFGDEFGRYYCMPDNNWVIYDPALIDKEKEEYASLRDENIFIGPKLYVTRTGDNFYSFYDEDHYASNNLFSFKLKTEIPKFSYFFIMAIMNSNFTQRYNRLYLAPRFGELFTETKIIHLKQLPIPRISFTTPEKERKKRLEEFKGMYCNWLESLASNSDLCQNQKYEKADEHKKPSTESGKMAGKPRRYKLSEEGISGEGSGLGGKVYGVREGTGGYKPPEGTPDERKDSAKPLDSTRHFETYQGIKPYSEVAETIAVSVAKTIQEIIADLPEKIKITPEWICSLHKNIAGSLFDWAGRFRDVNVQAGQHFPPPFYEVPVEMRLYCDDLAARLSHAEKTNDVKETAELLAWADWRFQWIHPFRDFNGRAGRVLLTAILFKLRLPPVETASTEPKEKEAYLKALHSADKGDLSELIRIWVERLLISTRKKEE